MTDTFSELSRSLGNTVAAAAPAVVRVEARRRLPASGIVWSTDGLIVSANHVVESEDAIQIGLNEGTVTSATVVGRDPATDLIVLRAEASDLALPEWVGLDGLQVGGLAVAIGRPYQNVEVSVGAISAVGGPWRTSSGGRLDAYIRPEITMYPGFSGGALIVADGGFVGLNTSGLLHHADTTIDSQTLKRTVDTIVAHGRVPRGFLGVGVQPVRIAVSQVDEAGTEVGLMVMSVEEDSPAESAGVRQGDILVALGDHAIASVGDLRLALSSISDQGNVILRLIRSNELLELTVQVELR